MENDGTGPSRKVARTRKRSHSCVVESSKLVQQAKKHKELFDVNLQKESPTTATESKDVWFKNSFCQESRQKQLTSCQQQAGDGDTSPGNDSGVMDTSDAILVDLASDLECQSHCQTSTSRLESCLENHSKSDGISNACDRRTLDSKHDRENSQIFLQLTKHGGGAAGDTDLFDDSFDVQDPDLTEVISSTVPSKVCVIKRVAETQCDAVDASTLLLQDLHHIKHNGINKTDTPIKKSVETESVSFKDRLKQKMKRNSMAPSVGGHDVAEFRVSLLKQAQEEAEEIQRLGTEVDIGPFFGLPSKVKTLLETQRGITKFYDWQEECLRIPAVLQGRNLIYSLPTSGGKTLVAEILILRELLCKKKTALLILPYVSIVQEKVRNLSQFAVDLDFLVEEYAGSKGRFPPIKHRRKQTLYIATMEKAHSLINSLIETGNLQSLGLAVVDELHMIGEGGRRGAILETTLTKLRHCACTQIVGMSATLNNIGDLQSFLEAEVYSNNFRPVQLIEHVKVDDSVYVVSPGLSRKTDDIFTHDRVITFPYSNELKKQDPDHLLGLVLEVIPAKSCLVFCHTKKNCENVAMMLAKLMIKHHRHLSSVEKPKRKALLQELYRDGSGQICPVLEFTIHLGIAYHHSGLTTDERQLIEEAYSEGTLCLLTCTSTLAAGVNLPAKRVILRSPYVGSEFISHSKYKQMTGRAGRAGIDDSGESILICKKQDASKVKELLAVSQEPCHSSLMFDGGKGIRSMLLSSIGLQMVKSARDALQFTGKTLLSVQSQQLGYDVEAVTRVALSQLLQLKLVRRSRTALSQSASGMSSQVAHGRTPSVDEVDGASLSSGCERINEDITSLESLDDNLEVTALGRATFKGSIDIDYCCMLYDDLKKAEESLVLSTYLHLLYLVTPYDLAKDVHIPWMVYFQQMNTLTPVEIKVVTLIGVPESYIAKKACGQNSREKVDNLVVQRFYLTLMLYELWRQKTVWQVAQRFQTGRGFVQNLLTSAASFASCVFHFCQELEEFWAFQDLLGKFVKRLSYCVSMELIPLMEITGVKLGRARQLYRLGLHTLQEVAAADPEHLVKNIEHLSRKAARQIIASAQVLLTEKTEALWEEVESLTTLPTLREHKSQNSQMLST